MKLKSIASILLGITVAHAKLVMIIRHGEKLNDEVTNLSPKGEARAACLINVFGNNGTYVSPQKIYAQSPTEKKQSTRPRDTVIPLANALGLQVDLSFSSGKVKKLSSDIAMSPEEIILVSWSNDKIEDIAEEFGIPNPPKWDGSVFDEIWMISDGTSYTKSNNGNVMNNNNNYNTNGYSYDTTNTNNNINNNNNVNNNGYTNDNGYNNGYSNGNTVNTNNNYNNDYNNNNDINNNNNSNNNSNYNNGIPNIEDGNVHYNTDSNYYGNTFNNNNANVVTDSNFQKRNSFTLDIVKQNIDTCINENLNASSNPSSDTSSNPSSNTSNLGNASSSSIQLKSNIVVALISMILYILVNNY